MGLFSRDSRFAVPVFEAEVSTESRDRQLSNLTVRNFPRKTQYPSRVSSLDDCDWFGGARDAWLLFFVEQTDICAVAAAAEGVSLR
jgi:hypothetical protein